ncbi:reverse transcriptase domain-containing protein [Tanacetum coccineum]
MAEKDEEKTAFFIREGVFCYRRLPFNLKNAGDTYQRLIDKVFGSQIGSNMEVDMVIKSDSKEEMLADIEEILARLRAINLKLNLRKCSFGVEEGIYSGYLIMKQGIRADPFKCREGPPFHENPEKLHEWKDGSVDNKSKRSLPKNKRMPRVTANNGYTNQRTKVLGVGKAHTYPRVCRKGALKIFPREHEIEFKGRNSIKGQILAKFLAKTSPMEREEEKNGEAKRKEPELENTWKLFIDRASSSDGSGAGLIYSIEHIKREQNKKADALSKLALMTFSKLSKEVLVEVIQTKSVIEKEITDVVKEDEDSWMVPIRECLKEGILQKDPQKARKLRIKAPLYRMIKGRLYRRSYMSPWLRCVGPMQAKNIIKEVHDGSCRMYSGPRLVVSKITRLGYYWPSMHKDTKELIHKCEASPTNSTRGSKVLSGSHRILHKMGRSKTINIYDKQTYGKIRMGTYSVQIWKASDNGKQFTEGMFPIFCKKLGTLQAFTSVYHPQANGQAHRTTPKSSNGETPFSLVYGLEDVIPIEISVETKRVQDFDSKENEKRRREDLDVLKERREIAAIKEAHYKQKLEGNCNKNVKPSTFKPGTYVL